MESSKKTFLFFTIVLLLLIIIAAYLALFLLLRQTVNIMPGTDLDDTPLYVYYFSSNEKTNSFCYYLFFPLCKINEALVPRSQFAVSGKDLDGLEI